MLIFIAACLCIALFVLEVMSLTYDHDHTDTISWYAAPHLVRCIGRSHLFCIAFICIHGVYIEVICPCYDEALSYGYVLKLEANKFTLILYLVYSISGTLC